MNGEFLIPIFLFAACGAVLWNFFDGRHKERMAMIEKGVNPAIFKSDLPIKLRQSNVLGNLKWGLLFVFVGIGLFVGELLHTYFMFHEETIFFSCMLISGGIGLILFYLIAVKKLKETSSEES